jgi:hypothetical protein
MELIINNSGPKSPFFYSTGVFIKDKFRASGFIYVHDTTGAYVPAGKNRLYCFEYKGLAQGDLCNKIMGFSSSPIVVNDHKYFPVN